MTQIKEEQKGVFVESKCKHIFSFEEGVDEAWLNYKPKLPIELCEPFDVIFKYCPLCGEELIIVEANNDI